MDLLPAFIVLYYLCSYACSFISGSYSVGCGALTLVYSLVTGTVRLIWLVIRILCVENQDDLGEAGRVLSSLTERFRQLHEDINRVRAANKGKNLLLHTLISASWCASSLLSGAACLEPCNSLFVTIRS